MRIHLWEESPASFLLSSKYFCNHSGVTKSLFKGVLCFCVNIICLRNWYPFTIFFGVSGKYCKKYRISSLEFMVLFSITFSKGTFHVGQSKGFPLKAVRWVVGNLATSIPSAIALAILCCWVSVQEDNKGLFVPHVVILKGWLNWWCAEGVLWSILVCLVLAEFSLSWITLCL